MQQATKIESYEDYLPKLKRVVVGQKELVVKELLISKRDAIIKILFSSMDIVTLLQPFIEGIKSSTKEDEITLNVTQVASRVKEILLKFLSKDMTRISCLLLDGEENRRILENEGFPINSMEEFEDQEFGFKYNQNMYEWIRNNLTIRQEYEVINAFMITNDFIGWIKNYWTLVVTTYRTARDLKEGKIALSQ